MALLSSRAGPASVERMRNADDVSKIMDENNTSVIVKHRGRVVGLVSPNDMMRIMVKVRRREGGREGDLWCLISIDQAFLTLMRIIWTCLF